MSITSWIAKVGTNPMWIAANAHCWFACSLVLIFHHWYTVAAIVAAAAAKEFLFDARYETDPPQTSWDNATDWAGYCLGAAIGWLA